MRVHLRLQCRKLTVGDGFVDSRFFGFGCLDAADDFSYDVHRSENQNQSAQNQKPARFPKRFFNHKTHAHRIFARQPVAVERINSQLILARREMFICKRFGKSKCPIGNIPISPAKSSKCQTGKLWLPAQTRAKTGVILCMMPMENCSRKLIRKRQPIGEFRPRARFLKANLSAVSPDSKNRCLLKFYGLKPNNYGRTEPSQI